jgi:hypothetical protein
MIPFKDHNGNTAYMSREEMDAVERSGRSSWQHWANVSSIPPRTQLVELASAMRWRPGKTPAAKHPRAGLYWTRSEIEMVRGMKGPSDALMASAAMQRTQEEVVAKYVSMRKRPIAVPWKPWEVALLKRWWANPKRRDALTDELKRTHLACQLKYMRITKTL